MLVQLSEEQTKEIQQMNVYKIATKTTAIYINAI